MGGEQGLGLGGAKQRGWGGVWGEGRARSVGRHAGGGWEGRRVKISATAYVASPQHVLWALPCRGAAL